MRNVASQSYPSSGDVSFEEFELLEVIKAHVVEPAHRELYREAVAFLDSEYSETAIKARRDAGSAKCLPGSPPVPRGGVPVVPDPLNATYRRLGAFFCDAVGWVLPDLHDEERIKRARAILYVAWITSDPDANERGVGLSALEQTPWDDPEMRVLGRWWSKMLAMEESDGWRELWMNRVSIAWQMVRTTLSEPVVASDGSQPLAVDITRLNSVGIEVLRLLIVRAKQAPGAVNSSAQIASVLAKRGVMTSDCYVRRRVTPVLKPILDAGHRGCRIHPKKLDLAAAILQAAESR